LKYIKATEKYMEQIYNLVQYTIKTIYPKYYPKEVVSFFCQYHSKERIIEDINNGCVSILIKDNVLLGTGSYRDNNITRVYVDPTFQGNGYGSIIMENLEKEIALKYDTVSLDASLPASHLYEHRGYRTLKHEKRNVENDVILVYEVMEKEFCNTNTSNFR